MSEIAFGTPEHIAGLSREALEADFRYVQDRRMELEEACERLQAENAELRELVRELYDELDAATQYDAGGGRGVVHEFSDRMRELGVEV